MSSTRPGIIPYLFCRDAAASLDWLARVFGCVETDRHPTPSGGVHGEMTFEGHRIMLGQGARDWRMESPLDAGTATIGVFVYLDDVDAHHARAAREGAVIEQPPHDVSYGRTYTARDLDGHPWFFTTPPRGAPR